MASETELKQLRERADAIRSSLPTVAATPQPQESRESQMAALRKRANEIRAQAATQSKPVFSIPNSRQSLSAIGTKTAQNAAAAARQRAAEKVTAPASSYDLAQVEDILASVTEKRGDRSQLDIWKNQREHVYNLLTNTNDKQKIAQYSEQLKELDAKISGVANLETQKTALQEQATMDKDMGVYESFSDEDRRDFDAITGYRDGVRPIAMAWMSGLLPLIHGDAADRLYTKYGKEQIESLVESYTRNRNAQINAERIEATEKDSQNSGLLDTALSIPLGLAGNVLSVIENADDLVKNAVGIKNPGGYTTLDPNTTGDIMARQSQIFVQGAAKNFAEMAGALADPHGDNPQLEQAVEKTAETVYSAGYSAAKNLLQVYLVGGAGSLALSWVEGYAAGMREATEKGATPGQAFLMGLVSGGSEVLTEKLSLDSLFGKLGTQLTTGSAAGVKSIVKDALKQGGVEVMEEELNFLTSLVAEAYILKEKSGYNQTVTTLEAQGMAHDQAVRQAQKELLKQAGETAVQSMLSGGMMSAATSVATSVQPNNAIAQQAQQRTDATTPQTPADGPQTVENKTGENGVPQTQTAATQAVVTSGNAQKGVDIVNSTIAQMHGDPEAPLDTALAYFRENGTVSNKLADAISRSPDAVRTLVDEVGLRELPRNASEKRAAIKQAVMDYAEKNNPPVDNQPQTNYDKFTTTDQGGNTYAEQPETQLHRAFGTELDGNPGGQGLRGPSENTVQDGRGSVSLSGILRISEKIQQQSAKFGKTAFPLTDTTSSPQQYSAALVEARTADTVNGWCVTPKSVEDLTEGNIQTITSPDGKAGLGVAPDGDITAVFKNPNGGPRGALNTLIPAALEMGGNKLDCYGEGLVSLYENYGFVPVAHVAFNKDFANPGWTQDKGTPYIYFMMHNGDSSGTVIENMKKYPHATLDQLSSLPTWGQDGYDAAWEYRDSLIAKQSAAETATTHESVGAAPQSGYGENTVGGAKSRFKHEQRKSKVYENTYATATDEDVRQVGKAALEANPRIAEYDTISEEESLHNATLRTRSKEEIDYEYNYLISKDGWTGEDNDTAKQVLDYMRKNGDIDRLKKLAQKQREEGTQGGQLVQSFAKYTRTPSYAADSAIVDLSSMTSSDIPSRFYKKTTLEKWKGEVAASIVDIANQIDAVEDGDVESMKNIIRSLANFRHTTSMFGLSSNLTKAAESAMKDLDFQTAKDIATAQLSQMPNDFRKRSAGQVVKTLRIHNMLSSIATINRNLVGNTSIGMVDAVSDSTVGRALDALVSLWTGKRTVGNDVKYAKAYFEGASKAAKMAALCAELDIPMESESRYSTGMTRTYSPQGGPVMRFMSAYEKYMRYALEVTDKFFEGGTNAAIDKSLNDLGENANLSQKEIAKISEMAGKRRTFKDDRAISRATKGVKKALNEFGGDNIGLGDLAIPFAGTGSNVTQTAIDYTGGGVISGLYEIAKLAKDVKNGVEVDAVRQRQAVTSAARGITGVGLIAAFAALAAKGIIAVHDDDDKDERALDQALGLSGAQFNVDAMLRAFAGKDTEWQDGDWTVSIDFLEPFNAQMYVGYLLSQEDSVKDMVKAFPGKTMQGVAQSILDMPMMQNLSDTMDLASGAFESIAEGDDAAFSDAAGQLLGNYGSSFIPSWIRQTAYMADPYYRDTTGKNTMEKSVNQLKSNIPGLSQTLPKKYSGLGEEQLRHDSGVMGFFNTYINPGKVSQISANKIADSLDQISAATGSKTIYPDYIAPGSFSYTDKDGKKQNVIISGKEMTETYQKTYGENVSKLYGALLAMEDFDDLEDKVKVSVLEKAKTYAAQLARAAVSDYSETPAYIKDRAKGMSIEEAILRQEIVGTTQLYTDLSIPKAAKLATLLKGILPEPGYPNTRTIQKIEAVTGADSFLSEKEQNDVLEDILPDETFDKYVEILAAGYSSDDFATAYRIDLDIEGEGAKEKTIRAFMKEFGVNRFAATKLYDLYHPKKEA